MTEENSQPGICGRIAQLREEVAGPRGKRAFAGMLGLPPSTYDYYEADRIPPAEVLLKIAEVAKVNPCWLLTGEVHCREGGIPANHPALQRMAYLLRDHPGAARPLMAMIDLLEETSKFPDAPFECRQGEQSEPRSQREGLPSSSPEANRAGLKDNQDWIPVLGRTAAGVPQFWAQDEDKAGLTELAELIERHAGPDARRVDTGVGVSDEVAVDDVQIITLTRPEPVAVAQFVRSAEIRRRFPRAFALQVDGDSMAPEILHGDLVILSPDADAADGRPAVVQLDNQIGVTCKLYRRQGRQVHLVAINEQIGPMTAMADEVVWALRVLARVRPGRPEWGEG